MTSNLGYELLTHPDGYRYWQHPVTGRVWPYVAGGSDDGGTSGGDDGGTDKGAGDDKGGEDTATGGDSTTGDEKHDDTGSDDPAKTAADRDKWKAIARQHEKRAKDNADAAKRLAELEDADKTAVEKASEALAKETKRADDAVSELARWKAAAKAGLDPKHIHRLHGADEDELLADAKALKAEFQPKVNGDADGGARGGDDKKKPASLEDAVSAALK
jgi:hypothetical protein